jgi:GNAT superfamily N-acetyltransferase
MMQHAQQQARAAACYKLVLSSNQKRERAHAVYESLGFQRHGFSFVIGI